MVEIGSILQAQVVRVEPYGIYLKYEEETVIVLAPDVSWSFKGDLREQIQVGEMLQVLVLRYNYQTGEIVGSIRRLHPEENPYRHLARLNRGEILQGKVTAVYQDGATVRLPNGARGNLPRRSWKSNELRPDEVVEVTIAALEVDEGILTLDRVHQQTDGTKQPVELPLATTPA